MDIDKYIKEHSGKQSDAQMGQVLHLTKDQVRHQRLRLVIKTLPTVTIEQEIKIDREFRKLKESQSHIGLKNKVLLSRIETLELELDAALDIKECTKNAYSIIADHHKKSEATAVWLASDWHVGEKVTMGQTNEINKYTPAIATTRAKAYFKNALRLTDMVTKDVEISTVVLALLGDFITGHLHLDAIENNYLAPVEETIFAQNLIISGIEYVLKNSAYRIVVPCHSGNHGRTTKFSHFGSENGHSLEYFMYCSIANYFRNEKRVKIIIPEGSHSYLDIYGYVVRFLHGHDVKFGGGVGGITIPINKAIAQWDKARPAYITCLGHFHQCFDGGSFMANGSMIGYNAFALSIKASAEKPAQQFFLIDKHRGKTVVAPILLDD